MNTKEYKQILYAPDEYWNLSKKNKDKICNKCGPKGTIDFVPDTIYGLYIGECCNIHDYMYFISKPIIEDKESSDRTFLNNILRLIDYKTDKYLISYKFLKIKNPLLILRKRRAYKYYSAVKCFGGPSFWKNKNDNKI